MPPPLFDYSANRPNIISDEDFYKQLREERNKLLAQTDWTVLLDVPISREKKEEYISYRQKLRDLPSTAKPDNITWPTIPS